MKLKTYVDEIEKIRVRLEKSKQSHQKEIDYWFRSALEEHATLQMGDVVQFEKHRYKIIEAPKIQSFVTPSDEIIWDLVYVGLRLKSNGETYHDSQSNLKRREIWQGYLAKGIATKVSA